MMAVLKSSVYDTVTNSDRYNDSFNKKKNTFINRYWDKFRDSDMDAFHLHRFFFYRVVDNLSGPFSPFHCSTVYFLLPSSSMKKMSPISAPVLW